MSSDCRVLLIEDELERVKLLRELLLSASSCSVAKDLSFQVSPASDIREAVEKLATEKIDLILLGLEISPPDGLNPLVRLRELAREIPIVVQTASKDETLVVKAFQAGADGYIQLHNLDRNLLAYQIRVAIERQQYIINLGRKQQEQQREAEFLGLEHLIGDTKTSVTAKMFGSESLRESVPDIYAQLVQEYGELLDLALEERSYKVEYNLSDRSRSIADKLGFLKASPRDVIDIHTTTLRNKSRDVPLARAQAYVVEGRLLVLELMGYLTSFYRKYYIGLSNINLFSDPKS
ncbi:response regulator [Pannus brasiliensis CCIBt3594]|uniref:Response regulator n=1 Tax=Pannus brasiliensis CCIBt3594 TaxID=1427578 RepID=A0AAW9QQG0_9CHRO